MSLLALLLAAQPTASAAPTPPLALLQAFRGFCVTHRADRPTAAVAAGFRSVSALPPTDMRGETTAWEKDGETTAWENGGIRLFEIAGRADIHFLASTTCGVSADIGAAGEDEALQRPFLSLPDYILMEVTGHDGRRFWNLVLRDAGLLRVAFDRAQPANVRMTISGTGIFAQSETR